MAMSDEFAFSDLIKQTQVAVALNPVLRPQIEKFWQAQEKMLQETQEFVEHWFERRHEATQTARKAALYVTDRGSAPSDAMKTISDWRRHSMVRVVDDYRDWVDLCTRCAGHVTTAEVEAEMEGLEKATKQIASGTKTKHSTPV